MKGLAGEQVNKLTDDQAARRLRQKIQAIRTKRLGWSEYVFRYVMEGLGYGKSLRDLDAARLEKLYEILSQYRRHGLPAEFSYDRQGRYMYSLQKRAGWDDWTLRTYLTINYQKTHWNLLTGVEKAAVIETLKQASGLTGEAAKDKKGE